MRITFAVGNVTSHLAENDMFSEMSTHIASPATRRPSPTLVINATKSLELDRK